MEMFRNVMVITVYQEQEILNGIKSNEKSKIKVTLTVFFDYRGNVHQEFLPIGQSVTNIMRRLYESIRKK